MNLDKFQFIILPANLPPHFGMSAVHNIAYLHYKNSWERILNRPGREALFNPDEFLRQDYVFQVMNNEEVVCQILGTHFHLDHALTQDFSYFQNFKSEAQETLRKENAKKLLSLEYSSVRREYSPKFVEGINFGEIITYLGVQYAKSIGVEAILGQPRRVTGTNERVINSGFRRVKANVTKCNVTVDLTLGFVNEIIEHPEDRTRNLINEFWTKRTDLLGYSTGNQTRASCYYIKENKNESELNNYKPILEGL